MQIRSFCEIVCRKLSSSCTLCVWRNNSLYKSWNTAARTSNHYLSAWFGLCRTAVNTFMSHLSYTFPWDLIRQWLEHNKSCESCVLTPELYGQLVAELLFYQLNLQIHHLRLNLRWWWLCFLSIPEVSYLNQRQHAFCLRSAVYLYLKWKIWLSGIILLCLTYFSDFLHANANQPGNTDFSTL